MPSLRNRTKSRTSTPLATPGDSSPFTPEFRKEKMQSSLDTWVEPAPQALAPSFEEHGLARHGVLETMAPLGMPPSNRVKQKARALGEATAKGSFGMKLNAYGGDDDGTTPEMTPAPELDRDDSERPDDEDLPLPFVEQEEEEDDDYQPKTHAKKKQKTSHVVKTPIRGKASTQAKPVSSSKSPAKIETTKDLPPLLGPFAENLSGLDRETRQRILIAVMEAFSRSIKDGRPEIGQALREMFNEGSKHEYLARALDGVIHQKETADDWTTFRSFIKSTKKTIKRRQRRLKATNDALAAAAKLRESNAASAARGGASSQAAGNEGEGASHSATLAVKPVDAPATRRRRSGETQSPVNLSDGAEFAETAANPFNMAPAFPATDATAPPAPRMGSKSPRKKHAANGSLNTDFEAGEASTAAATPAPKSPAGSDSGLSDVDEDILHSGPPLTPVQPNGKSSAAIVAAGKKQVKNGPKTAKKQASRATSTRPKVGKVTLTAEQRAQEAETEKRWNELRKEQQDRFGEQFSSFPMSDVRFEDDETSSVTESIAAMGPPGDFDKPRRAGRPPVRNGTLTVQTTGSKRGRDASSFSSPHPDSAVNSRPSTPAGFSHVPSKRLKLNNGAASQAARTKKSPVKNRDGPIAGIPHTGGGGSRQSGPDDNDPASPPSDSDDICSACKGAGEFVCCDTCPRVFHFLCCDPPRLDAPTGSFQCHECLALRGSTEDFSELPLGPLFKSLESTNTRAFALPSDIQNFFENVAARSDGSFFEDVKKLPLSKHSGYGYQRPDYKKLVDNEGKPIMCANCGQNSGGTRQMLKCDYCAAYWHLDCLDPPMANPPHINLESAIRDAWRCPRHIEHDFRSGYVAQKDMSDADTVMTDAPIPRLGRKVRKPRHPLIVEPTFSRGMRNNGLIEIINDPDDDTDGEGNYVFGGEEKDTSSNVYRVPEKGIILDFIDKVKSGRIEKAVKAAKSAAQRKSSMQVFAARPLQQQQAALNLARLANKETDIGLTENSVHALVLTLTAEAPNDVVKSIDSAPPAPLCDKERDELLKLQSLIAARLGGGTTAQ